MKAFIGSLTVILLSLTVLLAVFPATASAQTEDFEPRLTAPDSSNPYYNSELNVYSQSGYGMPNCVAYVYGRIYEITGEAPLISSGSASDWWYTNKSKGYYEYGQEPQIGAIACWSNHVAVVEKIEGNTITISQSHWGGNYFDTDVVVSGADRYGQTFYGYIYACSDYFEQLEEEQTQEIKTSFAEKAQDMSSTSLLESVSPQFSSLDLYCKEEEVLINSVMLKNLLESV